MKEIMTLDKGWILKKIESTDVLDIGQIDGLLTSGADAESRVFEVAQMPRQVQEILIDYGVIENPNIRGNSEKCLWIDQTDWLYVRNFPYQPDDRKVEIHFMGLDTFVDIYLNGAKIGTHNDVYLPQSIDISGRLLQENQLVLHFRSTDRILSEIPLPEELEGRVKKSAKARIFDSSYGDYLGPKPRLVRMGVYDEIFLEKTDKTKISWMDIDTRLDDSLQRATVSVQLTCDGDVSGCEAVVKIIDSHGHAAGMCRKSFGDPENSSLAIEFVIETPDLWWPRLHGSQPLYTVEASIVTGSHLHDTGSKKIGIRKIGLAGDLDFRINNLPIKLYGANLAPLDTLTSVYDRDKMDRMLQLAGNANCECLRVWASNERLDDDFYEQCDERGFLLWQDFFSAYSMYNLDPELEDLFRREAEFQVKRLKHHPSILLWCGGNESLMMRDYEYPGEPYLGIKVLTEIYPGVCSRFDPDRYYHRSSPDGGSFANDPLAGDTHGYTHIWYVPGNHYPVFLSENCRVSTPAMRTMKVMMEPDDLWPEGYTGQQEKNSDLVWPATWNKYNSNFGYLKLGEVEKFYDGTDLDAMLYRIGWGHGQYIRSRVERYRRGIPVRPDDPCERMTKGHILWKLNNSCNHIFFGVVDYFCEPYIAYYSMKRAYAPVLLSFEIGNFIKLYMVNDSPKAARGKVHVQLFDPIRNVCQDTFEVPFEVLADESRVLCDLNRFGQFKNNNILFAYAVDESGNRIAEAIDYCEMERRMRFPKDARIHMEMVDGGIRITTDKYARSIELLGVGDDGDAFGWVFDDNYFDLIPGDVKTVTLLRGKSSGTITAKAYYSDHTTQLSLR